MIEGSYNSIYTQKNSNLRGDRKNKTWRHAPRSSLCCFTPRAPFLPRPRLPRRRRRLVQGDGGGALLPRRPEDGEDLRGRRTGQDITAENQALLYYNNFFVEAQLDNFLTIIANGSKAEEISGGNFLHFLHNVNNCGKKNLAVICLNFKARKVQKRVTCCFLLILSLTVLRLPRCPPGTHRRGMIFLTQAAGYFL